MTARLLSPPAMTEPYELPVTGSLVVARWSTLVAAGSLGVAAIIGIRYGEQGLYQSDALVLPQIYGQDVVALFVVLPLMGLAVWSARRGSARGLLAWAGALVYLAYWYHFYLGAVPFGPLFLLHVALTGSSLLALGAIIMRLDVERLARRFGEMMPARAIAALMIGMSALFAIAWIVDVMARLQNSEVLDQVPRGVYAVDLTLMLPITMAAGILLWRRAPWGYGLAGPLLINAFLSILTLCVTSIMVRFSGMEVPPIAILLTGTAALIMARCVTVYLQALRG